MSRRTVVGDFAQPNPVSENRSGLIGKPVDRYEGPLKVSGTAPYAYEVETPSPAAYGMMITSPIAAGRIATVDASAAEALPGVRLVWTHLNVPAQQHDPKDARTFTMTHSPVLRGERIEHFGQPIGLVVADSLEIAREAAELVAFTYEAEAPRVEMRAYLDDAVLPSNDKDVAIGDLEAAFAAAPVQLDEVWHTPLQNHCQMEPHATTAWWDGDQCTLHTSVQMVDRSQIILANTLGVAPVKIRLITRYIGGGFGGKVLTLTDLVMACLAARALGRPVKLAFTRQQMFHGTVHRAATTQRVRLGATADGRLTAMSLIATTHTDRVSDFFERAANFSRNLYAAPNRLTGHRLLRLDLPPPGPMRAPGEAPGMLSLECAMDELAETLGLDPVELRLRNEPAMDPETGKPFSIRQLARCMTEGAERFGWNRRNPTPGQVRVGRWHVGLGMAAAIRGNFQRPAKAGLGIAADGIVTLRQGMTDIGTGTYTILAQITAETMGVPLEQVRVELGDSRDPPGPGSGGQFGAASAGSAALAAGIDLRRALAELAAADPASPLHGGPA
ncbi:MAG: xanthine dehydrogenase, partial [Caulobacteraceae bacterium]|nr:xanthine dehydrogenase [Caulobacteraceae bacterium]